MAELAPDVAARVRAVGSSALGPLLSEAAAVRAMKKAQRDAKHEQRLAMFTEYLRAAGEVPPVREWRFAAPARAWAFDLAWPEARVALEVDGGAFSGGRHTRGAGFREDQHKTNAAALLGWRVLRILPEALGKPETAAMAAQALRQARGGAGEGLPAFLTETPAQRRGGAFGRRKRPAVRKGAP